ncbi:roadblock/LC7 domain-containing protein, partial [archaeon]|nr:roadblock/LC7 domain-containing protein [archaeon]
MGRAMTTTKEMFEKILNDLRATGDVEASAIVSRDGLLMASNISTNVQADTFAAMAAIMSSAAETAITELGKGKVDRVIAESKEIKIITSGASENVLLVLMAQPSAALGLILVEMDKAVKKISRVMSGEPLEGESEVPIGSTIDGIKNRLKDLEV